MLLLFFFKHKRFNIRNYFCSLRARIRIIFDYSSTLISLNVRARSPVRVHLCVDKYWEREKKTLFFPSTRCYFFVVFHKSKQTNHRKNTHCARVHLFGFQIPLHAQSNNLFWALDMIVITALKSTRWFTRFWRWFDFQFGLVRPHQEPTKKNISNISLQQAQSNVHLWLYYLPMPMVWYSGNRFILFFFLSSLHFYCLAKRIIMSSDGFFFFITWAAILLQPFFLPFSNIRFHLQAHFFPMLNLAKCVFFCFIFEW